VNSHISQHGELERVLLKEAVQKVNGREHKGRRKETAWRGKTEKEQGREKA